MKERLAEIARLVDLDRRLHALDREIEELAKRPGELDAAEKTDRARTAKRVAERDAARERRRKADLEVRSLRERVDRYLLQQNQVKTNKEYEAITHEIAGVRAKIDEVETEGLEAVEREEALERELAERATATAALLAENAAERTRLAERRRAKEAEVAGLEAERDRRTDLLPEELRDLYDALDERFPGAGAVPIRGGACGGCGLVFVPQQAREVHLCKAIVRCEGCQRIVFDRDALGTI